MENPQLNTDTPNYSFYSVINGEEAETQGLDIELKGSIGKLDWDLGYARNSSELTADYLLASTLCMHHLVLPCLELRKI